MQHTSAAVPAAAKPSTAVAGIKGGDRIWLGHPVDIRASVPLPFGRYYLTLIAGPERRAPARVAAERPRHPMATLANFAFFFCAALAINAATVIGVLVYSSVLRF